MRYSGLIRYISAAVVLFTGTVAPQKSIAEPCPCDIYAAGGTPCVAAHSTVRALFSTYNGPLYQVIRVDNQETMDINPVAAGGVANAAAQDSFLTGTTGKVTIIYDQSGHNNKLTRAPPGGASSMTDSISTPTAKVTVSGQSAYGLEMNVHEGYRNNATSGMATTSRPEGIYWVIDGRRYNDKCCWDYGNAETNNAAGGTGLMHTLFFGNISLWGTGTGSGPWIMADFEAGVWSGGTTQIKNNPKCPSITSNYVSAMLKNTATTYTLRYGDAQSGSLKTIYDGNSPSTWKLQGGIILGIGGDNSNGAMGTFYEGAIAYGRPPDSTEDAVQRNIVAAYGNNGIHGPGNNAVSPAIPFKVRYNPSTANMVISSMARDAGAAHMDIFTPQGRLIAAIVSNVNRSEGHEAVWDVKRVPAGVYVCRAAIDGLSVWTGKIVIGK
jgi:non-reducing end alpha-L-arabinofuranosidase